MTPGKRTVAALWVWTAAMLACSPSLVPGASAVPTYDPNILQTAIVETGQAAASQTARAASPTGAPTNPLPPSATPSITASPTVTFIFILPTATVPSATPEIGSSGKALECRVVAMEPEDGSHLVPRKDFTMIWTIVNSGTEAWDANNMDYRYKSGDKLHKVEAYDMEDSPYPGDQVNIRVAMRTPDAAGVYATTWVINSGNTEVCRMSVTIQVP